MTYRWKPDYKSPPGDSLLETLEYLEMTAEDLANKTGMSVQAVHLIIGGIKAITPEIAEKIGDATDTPASLWVNLEKKYRER
jgi:addiction module HigA family antidote